MDAHRLPQMWRTRWQAWWDARTPRRDHQVLTQRNLYILPSKAGWGFGVVFLVLLLASINEQVNLGYALSFLLAGAAGAALYQTHGNLHGVQMRLGSVRSVHAGEAVQLPITLINGHRQRGRYGLQITAGHKAPEGTLTGPGSPRDAELPPGGETSVTLEVATAQRGWLNLPPLLIETRYPLGVFRAWAYWRPESRVLVWPALDLQAPTLPASGESSDAGQHTHHIRRLDAQAVDLREYRRGDPLSAVAWRKSSVSMAAGGMPVSREWPQGKSTDLLLDFDHTPGLQGLDAEHRLSRLASWLLEAEQQASGQGPLYGLRLPGVTLEAGRGPQHLRHCLDQLATWQRTP